MKIFKFSMLSFKTGDAQNSEFADSNVGEITVKYSVDAETLASTNGNFCAILSLGYDETTVVGGKTDLFSGLSVDTNEKNSVNISCDRPETEFLASHENNGSAIVSTYTFDIDVPENNTAPFVFTVTYTFNIPSSDAEGNFDDNFRQVFGQYLRGDTIQTSDGKQQGVTKFIAEAHVTKASSAQQ